MDGQTRPRGPIRLMGDYGNNGLPLWDLLGQLPQNEEFLNDVLGLTDQDLIEDLTQWGDDFDSAERLRDPQDYNSRGRQLFERLREALGGKFEIQLKL